MPTIKSNEKRVSALCFFSAAGIKSAVRKANINNNNEVRRNTGFLRRVVGS
ncbi:MAG: hypothetical protein QXK74_02315 [Candidatus Nitrosocaldaceae archaeon]